MTKMIELVDSRSEQDTVSAAFIDLLMALLGIILLICMAALATIGVPDVSKAMLEAMEVRTQQAEEQSQAMTTANANLEGQVEQLEMQVQQAVAAQVSAEAEADDYKKRLSQEQTVRTTAERQAREAWQQIEKTANLQTIPTDVVVVVDGTASMESALKSLRSAIKSIAEVGSRIAPKFRVGVVVYRSDTTTLPLTEVEPTRYGKVSSGMRIIKAFLHEKQRKVEGISRSTSAESGVGSGRTWYVSNMDAIASWANVAGGLRQGLRHLSNSPANHRKVLILVGDTGHWEEGILERIEPSERALAKQLCAEVRDFASTKRHFKLLTLNTGGEPGRTYNRAESAQFFKDLAAAAGEGGRYSDDTSQIAASVIEAVIDRRKK